MMKGSLNVYAINNDFFSFLLKIKEERAISFTNGPYVYGSMGMYLNSWCLYFKPNEDILKVFLVLDKIPQLPLSCWSDEFFRASANGVGEILDRA